MAVSPLTSTLPTNGKMWLSLPNHPFEFNINPKGDLYTPPDLPDFVQPDYGKEPHGLKVNIDFPRENNDESDDESDDQFEYWSDSPAESERADECNYDSDDEELKYNDEFYLAQPDLRREPEHESKLEHEPPFIYRGLESDGEFEIRSNFDVELQSDDVELQSDDDPEHLPVSCTCTEPEIGDKPYFRQALTLNHKTSDEPEHWPALEGLPRPVFGLGTGHPYKPSHTEPYKPSHTGSEVIDTDFPDSKIWYNHLLREMMMPENNLQPKSTCSGHTQKPVFLKGKTPALRKCRKCRNLRHWAADSCDGQLKKFTRFMDLPPELRAIIFRCDIDRERVICLRGLQEIEQRCTSRFSLRGYEGQALLYVSRESRAEALRFVQRITVNSARYGFCQEVDVQTPLYFNPFVDTIYLSSSSFSNLEILLATFEPILSKAFSIAIESMVPLTVTDHKTVLEANNLSIMYSRFPGEFGRHYAWRSNRRSMIPRRVESIESLNGMAGRNRILKWVDRLFLTQFVHKGCEELYINGVLRYREIFENPRPTGKRKITGW